MILASIREGTVVEVPSDLKENTRLLSWGASHLGRVGRLRRLAAQYPNAIFHAHSSFAGAYVRLFVSRMTHRIIYTPHCFAFERRDIGRYKRLAYRQIERLLIWNTTVVAACSERESSLARAIGARAVVVVPNVPDPAPASNMMTVDGATPGHTSTSPRRLRVVGVGRLSAQKDPGFFAATASALRDSNLLETATWIGGGAEGSHSYADQLTSAGVEVTGWLSKEAVAEIMSKADIYVHSAAWEGFPLAVLDAVGAGKPAMVREVECFASLPGTVKFSTPDELVTILRQSDIQVWGESNLANWRATLRDNTPGQQREMLLRVYEVDRRCREGN